MTAYAYTDSQLEQWAQLIYLARPQTTSNEILSVILRLATESEIKVDPRLGVQNILKHLYTKEEKENEEHRKIAEKVDSM